MILYFFLSIYVFFSVAASRPLYCLYRYTREARRPLLGSVRRRWPRRPLSIDPNRNRNRAERPSHRANRQQAAAIIGKGREAESQQVTGTEAEAIGNRAEAESQQATRTEAAATGGGGGLCHRWPRRIYAAAFGRRPGRTPRRARPGVVFALMRCLLNIYAEYCATKKPLRGEAKKQ